jgi:Eukaryotic aspartyl protease
MQESQTGNAIKVPVKRTHFETPVTKTQKMISEYANARRNRMKNEGPNKEPGRLQQAFDLDLFVSVNTACLGPAFFGTPLQGGPYFIYDSGSGLVDVTTTGCTSCSTEIYDPALSSTKEASPYNVTYLSYGSANLTGTTINDTVCLSNTLNNTCVTNFAFFEIQN